MRGLSLRRAALVLAAAVVAFGLPLRGLAAPALPTASAEATLRHLTVLSRQIGPRPSGTPEFQRAAEYVEGQLRALGFEVERQPFSFPFFEVRGAELRLADPGTTSFSPVVPEYSAATPAQGLDAPVVDAGVSRPEELQRAGVAGRIALVQRGPAGFLFRDKVENAAAAGAVAIVISNNVPEPVQQVTLLAPSRIPAVLISQADGQRLREMLRQGGVRLHLRVDTITGQRTTWNVIGRRAGRSARTVVLGGHLDTVAVSPGANDNGSGIAAALEAARLLAAIPLDLSVEIVAFGAEERGLLGSAAYVRERGERVAGMINMDMVGHGTLSVGNGAGEGPLMDLAGTIGTRLGLRLPRFRLPGASDHASFERAGITTVFIHTGDDPLIHTPQDTLERVDPQLMAQAAALAAAVAGEASSALR